MIQDDVFLVKFIPANHCAAFSLSDEHSGGYFMHMLATSGGVDGLTPNNPASAMQFPTVIVISCFILISRLTKNCNTVVILLLVNSSNIS